MGNDKTITFGQCVGENVRRIRATRGMSIEALVRCLRSIHAENWTKTRLATLERGERKALTEVELVQLASVLGVSVAELYEGDGHLQVGAFVIARSDWRAALSGERMKIDGMTSADDFMADEFAAMLSVSPDEIREMAQRLYGRTVTAERASRVCPDDGDPSTQRAAVKRGNATRAIAEELRPECGKAVLARRKRLSDELQAAWPDRALPTNEWLRNAIDDTHTGETE